MDFLKYFVLSVFLIACLAFLIIGIKSQKPFKFIILNALIGFFVLILLRFSQKYIGINLPINQYTAVGAAILGIPAIIGFLLFNLILI